MVQWIVSKKDLLTTIAGVVQLVVVTVSQYVASLNGAEINYPALVGSLAVALVGYFTGKKVPE